MLKKQAQWLPKNRGSSLTGSSAIYFLIEKLEGTQNGLYRPIFPASTATNNVNTCAFVLVMADGFINKEYITSRDRRAYAQSGQYRTILNKDSVKESSTSKWLVWEKPKKLSIEAWWVNLFWRFERS